MVEVAGIGPGDGIEDGAVGGLDAEHADCAGASGAVYLGADGGYGVEVLFLGGLCCAAIFHSVRVS